MDYEIIGDSRDRESWLALRRQGIGGSDAPAILGLTSWASPASVQADKWGLLEEPDKAEHLRWGQRLEAAILEGLADEIGKEVKPFGLLIRSKEHPFMVCTPDGETEGIFVQAKNTIRADQWRDGPPERVWAQVQHEMAVSGHPRCIVVALLLGNRLAWCYVDRDEKFIADVLIPAEREFWRLTQEMEPAPADGSEITKRALQLIYPKDSGESVLLDGSFLDLDLERGNLKERTKHTEARLLEIENLFRHAIKDATYATLPNGVQYSLKTQTRKAHEVKESTFRVLRRKESTN